MNFIDNEEEDEEEEEEEEEDEYQPFEVNFMCFLGNHFFLDNAEP